MHVTDRLTCAPARLECARPAGANMRRGAQRGPGQAASSSGQPCRCRLVCTRGHCTAGSAYCARVVIGAAWGPCLSCAARPWGSWCCRWCTAGTAGALGSSQGHARGRACHVQHALGGAGAAAGVQQEEQVISGRHRGMQGGAPVVCSTPLGEPVLPLVYSRKSGCSASTQATTQSDDCCETASCQHTSLPSTQPHSGTSGFLKTSTWSTCAAPSHCDCHGAVRQLLRDCVPALHPATLRHV